MVIAIPIRDRTLKDEIGERKEVMVSIVVVRQEVESAVDEQTPREDGYPFGVQEVVPDPQQNQDEWDGVEDVEEILPRFCEV